MKNKLVVGQPIFYKSIYGKKGDDKLKESTISKVGNKFFEIDGLHREKFSIETLYHVDSPICTSSYKSYLNEQDYIDEQEALKISTELRKFFDCFNINLSLDKLREIQKIINS